MFCWSGAGHQDLSNMSRIVNLGFQYFRCSICKQGTFCNKNVSRYHTFSLFHSGSEIRENITSLGPVRTKTKVWVKRLQKRWKFCNHQFFVFVILFAHEDANFFVRQKSVSNLINLLSLSAWGFRAKFRVEVCEWKIVIHMLRNLMTQWRMDVNEERIFSPDKIFTASKASRTESLKFRCACKNFVGCKKSFALEMASRWQIFSQFKQNFA